MPELSEEAKRQLVEINSKPKGAAQLAYNIQLRDLFAMHAMPIVADLSHQLVDHGGNELSMDNQASLCYQMADAMLRAR